MLLTLGLSGCWYELSDVVSGSDAGGDDAGCTREGMPLGPENRTANASFELGTDGWRSVNAQLGAVTLDGAPDGCKVARVAYDGMHTNYYLTGSPNLISASKAGYTYRASAWVRSATTRATAVYLHIVEPTEPAIATVQTVLLPSQGSFVRLEASAVAQGGHGLSLRVGQGVGLVPGMTSDPPEPGDAFYADLILLSEEAPGAGKDAGADGG